MLTSPGVGGTTGSEIFCLRTHLPEMHLGDRSLHELESLEVKRAHSCVTREELKPFVNANYRTNPDDSTYMGISFCRQIPLGSSQIFWVRNGRGVVTFPGSKPT